MASRQHHNVTCFRASSTFARICLSQPKSQQWLICAAVQRHEADYPLLCRRNRGKLDKEPRVQPDEHRRSRQFWCVLEAERLLATQAHLMSKWAGDPLDERGLVRILNPNGQRPPLIWCFNAEHEFPRLASLLGDDQPLIGIRSLHLIARLEPGRSALDVRMGDHYADILLDCLDGGLSFIGGNCQGVGVAAQLTARWSLAGRTCKSFIALEVEPSFPLPCPVALLFGAESELFNPYLRGEEHSAKLRWERMFPRPAAHIVPGGHGTYFTPGRLETLVSTIKSIRAAAENGAPLDAPRIRLTARPSEATVLPGEEVSVDLQIDVLSGHMPEVLQVAYFWRSSETRDPFQVSGQPVMRGASGIMVRAPSFPGDWDLILYPVVFPFGPLCWSDHLAPVGRVRVSDATMLTPELA